MNLRYLQKKTFRGRLPDFVYPQRKKGFGAPVGVWLRSELRDLVEERLGKPYVVAQSIFNPGTVAHLVHSHYNRHEDYTDQLLALTAFQLWYRSYGCLEGKPNGRNPPLPPHSTGYARCTLFNLS